jgi:hypothetical protein
MKKSLVALTLLLAASGLASADGLPVKFGGGLGFLSFTNDQNFKDSSSGQTEEDRRTYEFWGANVFADIGSYLTVYGGLWKGAGDAKLDVSTNFGAGGSGTAANNLTAFEVGAYVKYPFALSGFTLAPKIGVSDVMYLDGDIGGVTLTTDDSKQIVSPLSITAGMDVDWDLGDGWIFRVPFDLGVAINSRLSDDFYAGTYDSSNVVLFKISLAVARQF